jgi:hypothetical protein
VPEEHAAEEEAEDEEEEDLKEPSDSPAPRPTQVTSDGKGPAPWRQQPGQQQAQKKRQEGDGGVPELLSQRMLQGWALLETSCPV